MQNTPIDEEFKFFKNLPDPCGKIGNEMDSVANNITQDIKSDLVTSKARLATYFIFLSLLGYFLALVICGQNGVNILGSGARSEWFMAHVPSHWCAVICGAIFNGVPILFSFVLLNRFQRRFLLFRMPWLLISLPLVGCGGLIIITSFGGDETGHLSQPFYFLWACSAIMTPYLIESFAALILRQRSSRAS